MFLSKPSPVTIAVCDRVQYDRQTMRKSLLGVYPAVVADSFPHAMPPFWLDAPFTGVQGMLKLTLRISAPDGIQLYEVSAQATCGDPESAYEMTATVTGLVLAAPGVYLIEALADGVTFARRELRVPPQASREIDAYYSAK